MTSKEKCQVCLSGTDQEHYTGFNAIIYLFCSKFELNISKLFFFLQIGEGQRPLLFIDLVYLAIQ